MVDREDSPAVFVKDLAELGTLESGSGGNNCFLRRCGGHFRVRGATTGWTCRGVGVGCKETAQ